jgi:hypothetical protein
VTVTETCPVGASSDDAEAAALERAVPKHSAGHLRQIGDRSPADIAALRALAGFQVPNVPGHVAPGSARETLDPDLVHLGDVGYNSHIADPSNEGRRGAD